MLTEGNRDYCIHKQFKNVFKSDAFKDYSKKMMQYLEVRENMDPNNLSTLIETVFPFVNGNLQNVNMAMHKIDAIVHQLSQEVTNMTQHISIDLVDTEEEIKDNVTGYITVMKDVFKDELNKSSSRIHDEMKTQIANWNYKQADSLVAHADEILQITNDDDTDNLDILTKGSHMETTVTSEIKHPTKRSIHEISASPHSNEKHIIPDSFDIFNNLIDHYYYQIFLWVFSDVREIKIRLKNFIFYRKKKKIAK